MKIRDGAGSVQDQEPKKKARSLRVRVVDNTKDGRPAVNVNVPIGLVDRPVF